MLSLQKRWTDEEIGAVVDKSERDLQRRGGAGDETASKHKRKLFRQKVGGTAALWLSGALKIFVQARLLINYLSVVQQKRSNSISCEKVELKNRKLFKRKVHNLMNVLRMTTANKISPRRKLEEEDFQVEVVLASKLAYFM